ncbi:unnamed protein product [Sphagnum balticum]
MIVIGSFLEGGNAFRSVTAFMIANDCSQKVAVVVIHIEPAKLFIDLPVFLQEGFKGVETLWKAEGGSELAESQGRGVTSVGVAASKCGERVDFSFDNGLRESAGLGVVKGASEEQRRLGFGLTH